MSAALTPPTPENVAEMLTDDDGIYHDGNDWHPSLSAEGNVVSIGITPFGEDSETDLPEVHFRAVVVEGEAVPLILTPERLAKIRAEERARCVAELRIYSDELMPAAADQVIAGDDANGFGAVRFASSMARASQLLESGELSTPSALSSLPDTKPAESSSPTEEKG